MNTSSFLLVIGATTLGVSALFIAMTVGMNMSDDYASRLAVTSEEYLKLRNKALIMGKDPVKIKNNAARTQKPADYSPALSLGNTSPFVRSDSDRIFDNLTGGAADIVEAVKKGEPVRGLIPSLNGDSDEVVAARAGMTEEQLKALIELAKKQEKEGRFGSSDSNDDENTGQRFKQSVAATAVDQDANGASIRVTSGDEDDRSNLELLEEQTDSDVYTVHDEIRYQLATEEMSDEKRAMLESLLPKERPRAVRAVNVILEFDTKNCVVPRNSNSLIGVMFRHESQAIRGSSLNELDELILMRERCNGTLLVEDHAEAVSKKDIELRESRRDEVKYYLLQRRVPAESIVLSSL